MNSIDDLAKRAALVPGFQAGLEGKIWIGDCIDFLRLLPDKSIDLILTDPPYGIGMDGRKNIACGKDWTGAGNWDEARPDKIYFDEMLRVSKRQIIWGGNYYADFLPPSSGWLVWNKGTRNFSLGDGELAWSSMDRALRIKDLSWAQALRDGKRHPTQKSVELFKWCIELGSGEGELVLDPFAGSGTTAQAARQMNRRFILVEKNPIYADVCDSRVERMHQGIKDFL